MDYGLSLRFFCAYDSFLIYGSAVSGKMRGLGSKCPGFESHPRQPTLGPWERLLARISSLDSGENEYLAIGSDMDIVSMLVQKRFNSVGIVHSQGS
jgi:hypothetical protein